jgi:hypothetical protein
MASRNRSADAGRDARATMFARIGIMRALNRQIERTFQLGPERPRLELKAAPTEVALIFGG